MKNKLNLILLTILLSVCFTQLKAQTTEASITPEQAKAAQRLIQASGIQENMQKIFATVIQSQSAQIPEDKRPAFVDVMTKFFAKYLSADEVTKGLVPIYASE